ncbi:hypothetical protein LX32DRAFT_387246 [Colletotrichum zoysiae]|uniref:C2H2-type domain-containing protein n=1 Tax=Colletotrichum zoysiae TaxID=1216348 RepID=A0AAD9HH60_9PEZI|nr:hypothetical protein LX32DRAFT_387246 [Colletotrichum zoysiae]
MMVAEEVLLNSGGWYGSSITDELGRNPRIDSQEQEGSRSQSQGPYTCCNKLYNTKHKLNRHMKTHSKPSACPSEFCGYRCADKKGLRRHMQAYHSSQKHSFKCDGCDKVFTRQDNLTRHRNRRVCRR